MTSIWDLYLDDADAAELLHAFAIVERHRAIREPLPLEDAPRLLDRLAIIAEIAREEAVHWEDEAQDRALEADADGGRWGSPHMARTMQGIAEELATGSHQIAQATQAAVADLAPRLADGGGAGLDEAEAATAREAERLLARHPRESS